MAFVTEGLGDSVFSYLDDFIIFSSSARKHKRHLRSLMQRFERYGLFVIVKKCFLASRSVPYLGHQMTNKGMAPLNVKRDQNLERPRPRTVTELRSALGMLNYYRKHMANLSEILAPLHQLLEGERLPKRSWRTLKWNEAHQLAFTSALQLLQEAKNPEPQKSSPSLDADNWRFPHPRWCSITT